MKKKHLIHAAFYLTEAERPIYREHVEAYLNEYRPEGDGERLLVGSLCELAWTLYRVETYGRYFEDLSQLTPQQLLDNPKNLEWLSCFGKLKAREFRQKRNELQRRQSQRRLLEAEPLDPRPI